MTEKQKRGYAWRPKHLVRSTASQLIAELEQRDPKATRLPKELERAARGRKR